MRHAHSSICQGHLSESILSLFSEKPREVNILFAQPTLISNLFIMVKMSKANSAKEAVEL
jgi:hypothetical protein